MTRSACAVTSAIMMTYARKVTLSHGNCFSVARSRNGKIIAALTRPVSRSVEAATV